jgi:LPXTG-site transpeptidase (sortase) family protein
MYDTPPAHQVGHHQDSVQPGQPGNCVLSGHGRDDASFGRLVELTPAAEILVTNAEGETFTYTVTQVERLLEVGATIEERLSNARYLEDTEATRLTLVTCWPSWAYTHRIVVIAEPAG